jgi:putative oxidoreductase
MSSIAILLNRLLDLAGFFTWLPPLLARITLGCVFIESGWGKLHNLDRVTSFFESLGIPAAHIQAPFVAGLEFTGGILLLAGLATRLISLPLIGVMTVAILTAKKEELTGFSALTGFTEFTYILLLLWLIIQGAGIISIDALLGKKIRKLG